VYTASDYRSVKERCISLGIDEKHFISKRNNKRDHNLIKKLIDRKLPEFFSTELEVIISNEIPSNSPPTNPGTEPDKSYPSDNQKLKELKETNDRNKIPTPPVKQEDSVIQKLNNMIQELRKFRNIEAQHVSVFTDINGLYGEMSLNAQIALCKFFLEPFDAGFNTFVVDEKFFQAKMEIFGEEVPESDEKAQFSFKFHINRINRQLLALTWEFKEEISTFHFDTLDSINDYISNLETQLAKAPKFIIDLIEFFAAQRLAQFYLEDEYPKDQILDIAEQLNAGMGGLSFIANIWEHTTFKKTKNAKETIKLLEDLKEKRFPEIEEVFYCKITNVDIEDGVVDTEIFSLEDNTNFISRSFNFSLLKKVGLKNVDACFKLLILNTPFDPQNVGGRTFYIEPLPLSAYYRKYSS